MRQYKMHEGCWALELAQGQFMRSYYTITIVLKIMRADRLDSSNDAVRFPGWSDFDWRCPNDVRYSTHICQGNDRESIEG